MKKVNSKAKKPKAQEKKQNSKQQRQLKENAAEEMIKKKEPTSSHNEKKRFLSKEGEEFVKKELKRYESKRSAILPCLYRVQEENKGWIPFQAVPYLSKLMDLPEAWINEARSFYTLFNKEFKGKYHIQVCGNLSCYMNGSENIVNMICKKIGLKKEGEVSEDGRFSLTRVECLGSCDTAPVMQINEKYYENLTPEKAISLLRKMEN